MHVFPDWLLRELKSVLGRVHVEWRAWSRDMIDSVLPAFGRHFQRGEDDDGVVLWRPLSDENDADPLRGEWREVDPRHLTEGRFLVGEVIDGRFRKAFDLCLEGCEPIDPQYQSALVRKAFRVRYDLWREVQAEILRRREEREKKRDDEWNATLAEGKALIDRTLRSSCSDQVSVPGFKTTESGILIPS